MIGVVAGIFGEMSDMIGRGGRTMGIHGVACALLLAGIVYAQFELTIPVWAQVLVFLAFLFPHTIFMVALIRGMLMQNLKERLVVTLAWRLRHTNLLYDSFFFLVIGGLILFTYDAFVTFFDMYLEVTAEGGAVPEELVQTDLPYIEGMKEAFTRLQRTGVLAGMLVVGLLFLFLMVVWARNIIAIPATALGYRIRNEEARMLMRGYVLFVVFVNFAVNGLIAVAAWAMMNHVLADRVALEYAAPAMVGAVYWVAMYVNIGFWCSLFLTFTAEYDMSKEITAREA